MLTPHKGSAWTYGSSVPSVADVHATVVCIVKSGPLIFPHTKLLSDIKRPVTVIIDKEHVSVLPCAQL